jgi:heat shock protein HtpX
VIAADTALGRVEANRRRALLLLLTSGATCGAVIGLISLVVVAPTAALGVAVVVAAAVMAAAWWYSEALAGHLVGAAPADAVAHARLVNLVEGLCFSAGIPRPALYVLDDPAMNTMTMGRNPRRARLVATSGLLERLNRIELEAVVAHELSHIKSHDILPATLAVALFGIFAGPARASASAGPDRVPAWLTLPVTAPAGLGLQWAVGHQREETADLSGVALTRYPPALVSALEKLEGTGTALHAGSPATAHLWLAQPAPAPPPGRQGWMALLFETHPALHSRIEALREL